MRFDFNNRDISVRDTGPGIASHRTRLDNGIPVRGFAVSRDGFHLVVTDEAKRGMDQWARIPHCGHSVPFRSKNDLDIPTSDGLSCAGRR